MAIAEIYDTHKASTPMSEGSSTARPLCFVSGAPKLRVDELSREPVQVTYSQLATRNFLVLLLLGANYGKSACDDRPWGRIPAGLRSARLEARTATFGPNPCWQRDPNRSPGGGCFRARWPTDYGRPVHVGWCRPLRLVMAACPTGDSPCPK